MFKKLLHKLPLIRILLKKKLLYETINKDGAIESLYRYIYLDLGYKGKGNTGQSYFFMIYQEDYTEIFRGADILWNSKF